MSGTLGAVVVLGVYAASLVLLALFGLHRYRLLLAARRARPPAAPANPGVWPLVTVELPIYNEFHVVHRLLAAVAALDYPLDRLEIQVLDDSDDDTAELAAAAVARLAATGLAISHVRRERRTGFKAGALAHGLALARGEFVAIFDADFVPPADFLRRTIPHLAADPRLGMVQARWGHLNRQASLLTEVQALLLDGHFAVDQRGRYAAGLYFNFNGTAGVWRRSAIEAAGGWQSDTLTEDLDLSYRAQLAGFRFAYLDDLVVPAELPADVNAFKSQQRRWARGSLQTARKLLPRIAAAPVATRLKLEAVVHLCGNLAWPLLAVLAVLSPPALVAGLAHGGPLSTALHGLAFVLGTLSVVSFYVAAMRGPGARRRLAYLPVLMAVGAGLALTNGLAVGAALLGRGGDFVRTAKTGRAGVEPGRYRGSLDVVWLLELAFAAYFAVAMAYAWDEGLYLTLPFFAMFLCGFGGMGIASLLTATRRYRWRSGAKPGEGATVVGRALPAD